MQLSDIYFVPDKSKRLVNSSLCFGADKSSQIGSIKRLNKTVSPENFEFRPQGINYRQN